MQRAELPTQDPENRIETLRGVPFLNRRPDSRSFRLTSNICRLTRSASRTWLEGRVVKNRKVFLAAVPRNDSVESRATLTNDRYLRKRDARIRPEST
jgi:hypothetical protein